MQMAKHAGKGFQSSFETQMRYNQMPKTGVRVIQQNELYSSQKLLKVTSTRKINIFKYQIVVTFKN